MESKKAYVEQCSVIKQAKAHLAELDGSTDREAGTSRKSNKKSNVTTAEASQADLTLQADVMSEFKQAQEASGKAKAMEEQAAADIFQLNANLLSVISKYTWN